jgi:hypothetical protein
MICFALEDHGLRPGGRWLVLGMSRDRTEASPPPQDAREVNSLDSLAAEDATHVAIIKAEMAPLFCEAWPRLASEIPAGKRGVIVLVALRQCPWPEAVSDGRVYSFLATMDVFRELLAQARDALPWQLCFRLLFAAMNDELPLDRLLIRQLPYPELNEARAECPAVSVIMAHRGSPQHLCTALQFLDRVDSPFITSQIGLDVENPAEYLQMTKDFPRARFLHVQPSPAGPYVIRQELAERSISELMMLHDSDDVSCSDRVTSLYGEMCASNCDFVGSHELRVDELTSEIFAIRFPLDVTAALREKGGHALLHGTGMIRRDSFLKSGGLSTDQMVANDTQFLFRAYFYMKIRNVNSFLYVRRTHARALTVAPETANGTPLRLELDQRWRADFQRIKQGDMTLAESSLRQMRTTTQHRLVGL